MNKKVSHFIIIFLAFSQAIFSQQKDSILNAGQEELANYIGTQTYIYGLPVVLNYQWVTRMKGVAQIAAQKDSKIKLGNVEDGLHFNKWIHVLTLATHEVKTGATPNDDTNYSICFADLTTDPIVLKVPPIKDRYFAITLSDAYLENVAYISKRMGDTNGGNYILIGPNFKGQLPKNCKVIKMPHNFFVFVLRIQLKGGNDGFNDVTNLQKKFDIQSLSKFTGKIKKDIKKDLPEIPKINNALEWYAYMLKCMQACPPIARDSAILKQMALIGLKIDGTTDVNLLSPPIKKGLERAFENSKKIVAYSIVGTNKNAKSNWFYTYERGKPGTNYLQRAHYVAEGMYTNDKEEAMYPQTILDENGNVLNGKNNYIMHIPKDKVGPVNAFWSFTAYIGSDMVPNKYFHYSVGDGKQYPVKRNADGSVDIYFQNKIPDDGNLGNWVPTPTEGQFRIVYRLYEPKSALFNGDFLETYLPGLQKTK